MHEKRLVKYLITKNFSISIGRESIKYQSREAEPRLEKSGNFRSIENQIRSIESFKNQIRLIENQSNSNLARLKVMF